MAIPVRAAHLTTLTQIASGSETPHPTAVSNAGRVVVGDVNTAMGLEAFRWTPATGTIGLGDFPGGNFQSEARGVSADGNIIVGYGVVDAGGQGFMWTEASGMIGLAGDLPPPNSMGALGLSGDGLIVVGSRQTSSATSGEGVRWTARGGVMALGGLPGATSDGTTAWAANYDGSVIVGVGELPNYSGGEPMRWTESNGMVGLGHLPGVTNPSGIARSVSNDGTIIVGNAAGPHGSEAFRWTPELGMVGLGDLPGGIFRSVANGISGDGSIIVGNASVDGPPGFPDPYQAAFIWDPAHGMRRLIDVLASEYGLALPGWQLISAAAISNDGLAIVGGAQPPQGPVVAYEVLLPEPATAALLALATLLFRRRSQTA
ncbi:MAG: PEP-CTERM sorting domain-containing protein [Phycisphaerae bacterium]